MRVLMGLLVLSISSPALAENVPIVRHGFTGGLSLGAGGTLLAQDGVSSEHEFGLGGLNLEIGGFVTPNVALLFKIAGVNYGSFDDRLSVGVAETVGAAAQIWFEDRLNLVVGGGLGLILLQPRGSAGTDYPGFGMMLTLNYVPVALAHHGIGVALDVEPVFANKISAVAYQLGLSWQYY